MEKQQLASISDKIQKLQDFLRNHHLSADGGPIRESYRFLNGMKGTIGNWNNDVSFVATLLAKQVSPRKAS